ncbi:MAG: energy-coupling factor transporter ATPase [Firmicutes bacterium]|nr:energy-coupling factor transporter ATPase [Bacillota bacterium]
MSIEVSKLTHVYDEGMPTEQVALEDVSFRVEDGEILGIIGHTGSGKSTLLQHLDGLLKPNSGTIVIGDTDITKSGVSLVEIRKRVGLVFQYPEYQLFEETVEKDAAYGPGNLGLSPEEIDERVREALTLVGLDYNVVKDRSPFELSGGQKRAVAIAGVIAMRPQVLILDEPTAGLDPRTHADILNMIRTIHQKTGNIIILVSHNMGDIAAIADKVMVMDTGRVIAYGTPLEIFSRADELREVGLDLPPITEFCKKLGIDDTVLTVDEAVKKIKEFVGA